MELRTCHGCGRKFPKPPKYTIASRFCGGCRPLYLGLVIEETTWHEHKKGDSK